MKLKAIEHKFRWEICKELAEKGEQSVTQLWIIFRCEQSVVSQHLAILRTHGYVNTRRDGKEVFYSLNDEMEYISTIVSKLTHKSIDKHGHERIPVHQDI